MLAIGIGVFVFIQLIVLVFAFALCRSAARADKEFEHARLDDRRYTSRAGGQARYPSNNPVSPTATPARGARSAARIQNR